MDKDNNTVNTTQSAVTETTTKDAVVVDDAEARIAALEAEKSQLIEETANWKLAALKNKGKIKEPEYDEEPADEGVEEKMRRVVREELHGSRIAAIESEKEILLKKALKENRELKLAQANRTGQPLATIGTHSEAPGVQDTLITNDQMAAFKAQGRDDKWIERYKKNLSKVMPGGGR